MLADLIRTAVFRLISRSQRAHPLNQSKARTGMDFGAPESGNCDRRISMVTVGRGPNCDRNEVGDCNETSMFTGWKWVRNECGNRGIKLNAGESYNPKASFVLNSKWNAHRM